MTQELGFPYGHVAVSAPLTDAEYVALRDVDLSIASLTGTTVTIGSETVTVADVKQDVKSISPQLTFGEVPRTSLADDAQVTHQGRANAIVAVVFFASTATNAAILDDPKGIRLLYIERPSAKKLVMLGSAFTNNMPVADENGDATFEVEFRNAGGKQPKWS